MREIEQTMDILFDCACGRRVKRLIYPPGGTIGCERCVERKDMTPRGIMHTSANNKFASHPMTVVDKLNITTRDRRPDGSCGPAWHWR